MAKPYVQKPTKKAEKMLKQEQEYDSVIVDLARVTRVMAGGKRMRFRACVAAGNHRGKIGVGVAKGADVTIAVNKATNAAKKKMIVVPIVDETIPHKVYVKFNAARILMRPAKRGKGVKAGGVVRIMCELAGVGNIVSKILGTNNKLNNAKAVIEAFKSLKSPVVIKKEDSDKSNKQ